MYANCGLQNMGVGAKIEIASSRDCLWEEGSIIIIEGDEFLAEP